MQTGEAAAGRRPALRPRFETPWHQTKSKMMLYNETAKHARIKQKQGYTWQNQTRSNNFKKSGGLVQVDH
jgi:hypothetical protein